ncbi:MAG: hypothetical protein IT438_16200 [Phycisphaerales bacterium]|nr:hypothetical protein [Phycisphaerales bacterium]
MAGQGEAIGATVAVIVEAGLLRVIEPLLAESWSRWPAAIDEWRWGSAETARPLRVTKVGSDDGGSPSTAGSRVRLVGAGTAASARTT